LNLPLFNRVPFLLFASQSARFEEGVEANLLVDCAKAHQRRLIQGHRGRLVLTNFTLLLE